ncbi:MlaC/ttg2D family ABC transporter substrate-binding protein [Gallionella capsiferriformans]|uniref:Toluene tolerance family protein n=1 Tax=Gallionella capsiferriformans (strain ES-2) TaxID=395494 RepID=D9SCB6_GALCS|nr:ABC transporter substrate-binding protein [Gallionella capsiferriformans]ADL54581.1 toluene tolerance family protein [Gallionella capsiferriformans ES-2]
MKRILLSMVVGLSCVTAQAEIQAPDAMIKDVAQEVIVIIKQDAGSKADNQKKILALVDARVLPNFDFTHMTQLAVGRYWRQATPEQQKALVAEFRNMLVRTYANALSMYRDQKIEVRPVKMNAGDKEVVVNTRIIKSSGQPTLVDYKMEKEADGWKVYDVVIEAVSLVTNYRGQFATTIQQSGIDGLIKELSGMNAGSVRKADVK